MMNWLYYLLEANLYLAVFYGFYRMFLHGETFYQLNRYYLLFTPVLAFLLPLFQIGYLNSLMAPRQTQASIAIQYVEALPANAVTSPVATSADNTLLLFYLLVAGCFLVRFVISLCSVFMMAAGCHRSRTRGVIQVHIGPMDTAFSFFNLLFIPPGYDKQEIIVEHEMVHIRQKHSLDILFFEILVILNWFNPLCWLIRRDIKLVHEYIADEATTNHGLPKHEYALFLIRHSFGTLPNPLTSQMFNQSILKNRISMLNKKRSAGRARLRLLYVLPLTGGMLCASTLGFAKDYSIVDLYARKAQTMSAITFQEPKQQPKNEKKKKVYLIESRYDAKTGNNLPIKLIVINGKISKAVNFASVESYDQVTELSSSEAVAKYGKRASEGALEFTGKNAGITIKFPPPKVTKVEKKISFPPPLVKKEKTDTVKTEHKVKFPPPLVKPDAPAEPEVREQKQVKFPPPIVKPLKKYDEKADKPAQTATLDVGPNPLYVIDGKVTVVKPGDKKIIKFTAKSVTVHHKNHPETIKKYGELGKDGVIELEDGEVFYAEPDSVKKQ